MKNFHYENSMQSAKVILNNLLNKYLGKNLLLLEKKNENELRELEYLKNEANNYLKKNTIILTNNSVEKIKEISKPKSRNTTKKFERDLSGGDRIIQKKNEIQKDINNLKKQYSICPFPKLNKSVTQKKKISFKKSKTINNLIENKKSKSNSNLIHIKSQKKIKITSKDIIKNKKIKKSLIKTESNQSNNSSLNTKCTEKNIEEVKIIKLKKKSNTPDKNYKKSHIKNESIYNIFLKDISFEELLGNDNSLINNDLKLSSIELGIINDYSFDTDKHSDRILNINNEIKNNNLLSLENKLKTNYKDIFKYLNNNDIFPLAFANKYCFNYSIGYIISTLIKEKEKINEELKKFNNKQYNQIKSFSPFSFNNDSKRALSLLNESSSEKLFNNKNSIPNKDIILIYHLYICSINPNLIKNNLNLKDIWNKVCNYFNKRKINNIGLYIEKELTGKIFDKKIINRLYNILGNNIKKITPNYYKEIDKITAIFVYIVKDIFEFIGIIKDENTKSENRYFLLNTRLEYTNILLEKLNNLFKKFSN